LPFTNLDSGNLNSSPEVVVQAVRQLICERGLEVNPLSFLVVEGLGLGYEIPSLEVLTVLNQEIVYQVSVARACLTRKKSLVHSSALNR
jgi:hypothetical protein